MWPWFIEFLRVCCGFWKVRRGRGGGGGVVVVEVEGLVLEVVVLAEGEGGEAERRGVRERFERRKWRMAREFGSYG